MKEKISWDQSLTQNKLLEWNNLINDVSNLKTFCTNRKLCNFVSPDLHIFADSSMNALGAVAYFVENNNVSFVLAKSKLVPLKPPSLPQLELTALNVAATMSKFIVDAYSQELNINKTYLWSDSKISLCWVKKPLSRKSRIV